MKTCGIYKITSPSGKVYIGQSINIERRFKTYKRKSFGSQFRLERSILKYGCENHIFEILKECEEFELNELEYYFQLKFDCIGVNGLNCVMHDYKNKTAEYCTETRLKRSLSKCGNNNPNYGKKHTQEHKFKMSLILKGRIPPNKGKKLSQESRDKIKENNAKYWLGKKYTADRILKMSEESTAAKLVINIETGIFYDSVKMAALAHGINYNSLMGMINPNKTTHKNKTNLIYV